MARERPNPLPRVVAVLATLLLIGGALGALGYTLGKATADDGSTAKPARGQSKPDRPAAAGAENAEPAPEPRRTYAEGLRKGRAEGMRRGARQALGGFDFAPATFYVVQLAQTGGDAELRISGADRMLPGRSYLLCNTNDLCSQ